MKRLTSKDIPGVKVLPFWQAKYFTPAAIREVRAIVWHFAQGGGTDSWLLHPSSSVSCHLVVKYSGAVRQLVEFDDASHSLHINWDTNTADAPDFGIFSLQAVKDALGSGWTNPNRYIIAIEVEGFEAKGANLEQLITIKLLAHGLERLFPKAVHLGHRDFQDYKRCPGHTLFTKFLPHGGRLQANTPTPPTTEAPADMSIFVQRPIRGAFNLPKNTVIRYYAPGETDWRHAGNHKATTNEVHHFDAILNRRAGDITPSVVLAVNEGPMKGFYVSAADVDETYANDRTYTQEEVDVLTVELTKRLDAERAEDLSIAAQLLSIAETLKR